MVHSDRDLFWRPSHRVAIVSGSSLKLVCSKIIVLILGAINNIFHILFVCLLEIYAQLYYCYVHLCRKFCLWFVGCSSSKIYRSCGFFVVGAMGRSAGCSKLWVGFVFIDYFFLYLYFHLLASL